MWKTICRIQTKFHSVVPRCRFLASSELGVEEINTCWFYCRRAEKEVSRLGKQVGD